MADLVEVDLNRPGFGAWCDSTGGGSCQHLGHIQNELREQSVRLVAEAMAEDAALSLNGAVKRVGERVGVVPDTLRGWTRQLQLHLDANIGLGSLTHDAR